MVAGASRKTKASCSSSVAQPPCKVPRIWPFFWEPRLLFLLLGFPGCNEAGVWQFSMAAKPLHCLRACAACLLHVVCWCEERYSGPRLNIKSESLFLEISGGEG